MADATGIVDDKVSARSWCALGLLLVVYVFTFLDRSILGILAQPIKEESGTGFRHS